MIFELCYIEVIKFIHIPCLFDVFEICHRSHSTLCTLFQITEPTKIQVKIGQLILSPLLSYRKVCTFASQSRRQPAPSATWLLQTASHMTSQSQTNTQREDARNSVIETATQMFHAQGIRNVTMDDIAHKLSMSKRTLYQLFTDKEDLLLACVIKHEGDVRTHLAAIISQSANVLDFLLIIFKAKMKEFDEIVPSFFADLTKYPRIKEHIARNKQQQEDEAVSFLERGIKQGLFREGVNFHIITRLLSSTMEVCIQNGLADQYSQGEIFLNTILPYIRGCATLKGVEMIDQFLAENNAL